jgi:hypothetical protein
MGAPCCWLGPTTPDVIKTPQLSIFILQWLLCYFKRNCTIILKSTFYLFSSFSNFVCILCRLFSVVCLAFTICCFCWKQFVLAKLLSDKIQHQVCLAWQGGLSSIVLRLLRCFHNGFPMWAASLLTAKW